MAMNLKALDARTVLLALVRAVPLPCPGIFDVVVHPLEVPARICTNRVGLPCGIGDASEREMWVWVYDASAAVPLGKSCWQLRFGDETWILFPGMHNQVWLAQPDLFEKLLSLPTSALPPRDAAIALQELRHEPVRAIADLAPFPHPRRFVGLDFDFETTRVGGEILGPDGIVYSERGGVLWWDSRRSP